MCVHGLMAKASPEHAGADERPGTPRLPPQKDREYANDTHMRVTEAEDALSQNRTSELTTTT